MGDDWSQFDRDCIDRDNREAEIQQKDKEIERLKEVINKALILAEEYGGIDGDHHKAWIIDQMVRTLLGDKYNQFVKNACAGEDGPNTYEWDVGIAP